MIKYKCQSNISQNNGKGRKYGKLLDFIQEMLKIFDFAEQKTIPKKTKKKMTFSEYDI